MKPPEFVIMTNGEHTVTAHPVDVRELEAAGYTRATEKPTVTPEPKTPPLITTRDLAALSHGRRGEK